MYKVLLMTEILTFILRGGAPDVVPALILNICVFYLNLRSVRGHFLLRYLRGCVCRIRNAAVVTRLRFHAFIIPTVRKSHGVTCLSC